MGVNVKLAEELSSVYADYLVLFDKFSEQQVNEVPFEGSWTPGQVAAHIIKATKWIPDRQTAPADRPFDEKVESLESVFLDFTSKMKSPDFVLPGDGPFSKSDLLQEFRDLQLKHDKIIRDTDLTKICLNFEIPGMGTLTRYEWYRFFVAHGKRHLFQLNNILKVIKN